MTHTHTTDLEHSKKLADACQKMQVEMPESVFYWYEVTLGNWQLVSAAGFTKSLDTLQEEGRCVVALQLGSLMRMLPHEILFKSNKYYLSVRYYLGLKAWVLKYLTDSGSYKLAEGKNEVPENAACELLTELILSGKVTELSI